MSPMGKCRMGICRHGYMSHGYMSPNCVGEEGVLCGLPVLGDTSLAQCTEAICLDNLGTSALYGMVPGLLGG